MAKNTDELLLTERYLRLATRAQLPHSFAFDYNQKSIVQSRPSYPFRQGEQNV